nr:cyclic peptide export ABC transporter [Undibacterium sp. TS12]
MIKLLWRESPYQFVFSIVSSLLTAIFMLILVTLLSQYLGQSTNQLANWWQFLLLAMATTMLQVVANIFISSLTQTIIQQLRSNLVRRIIGAPMISIEQARPSSLLTSLVDDAGRIADALPGIIALVRDMTFMVVCFAYLAWLSYKPLLIIFAVMGIGMLLHTPLQKSGVKNIMALRTKEQQLFGVFKNMVEGIKQLKLSGNQRKEVIAYLENSQTSISKLNTNSLISFSVANAYAVLLFLILIEILIFGKFSDFVDHQILMAYTLSLMFLLGPLQNISSTTQQLGRAGVALGRIHELENALADTSLDVIESNTNNATSTLKINGFTHWKRLVMSEVTYHFKDSARQDLDLGPFNVVLEPGDVLFVVGGNGSGKTTFAKILAGLYAPGSGHISLDHIEINDTNRQFYRQQFGAVFADFTLFDGLGGTEHDPRVDADSELLRQLRLDHVVDPNVGLFAQAASFSSGERRRVAMLLACLDDKPAYVFDEFAADQDPECRELFYHEIVPRLRALGKLIVVITHDSRFFDCADLILTLERGMPPTLRNNRQPVRVAS